ncbi:hypothetical protein DFJ73DRAFT_801997 [Zopfochytrium polystomum]|nr:hypothetical protein DFJ73DRAFT_801997 [Zopfochytrium polystomum]
MLRHAIIANAARDVWSREIKRLGFDAAAPILWVVEGLLPYLPADAESRVLQSIDRLSAPGSQLVGDTWVTGQFQVSLSAEEGGDGVQAKSSSTVDQQRKGLQSVCTGARWDEVALPRIKLKKEDAIGGPWRMELVTKDSGGGVVYE